MHDPQIRRRASTGSHSAAWIAAIGGLALSLSACAKLVVPAAIPPPAVSPAQCEDPIALRAAEQQSSHLESEVMRLQLDLEQAEAAMIAIESGMLGHQNRADAVSVLAEARISVESARQNVPWRALEVTKAQTKLEQAEKQLQAGNLGTAIFFASRAHRIGNTLIDEAQHISASPGARLIGAQRVNLRSGPSTQHRILEVLPRNTPVLTQRLEGPWWLVSTPSGQVGWLHAKYLQ